MKKSVKVSETLSGARDTWERCEPGGKGDAEPVLGQL